MPDKTPGNAPDMRATPLTAGVNCGGSSHCAQPGDNLVDQPLVSVGAVTLPWDGLWGAAKIPALIPSELTDQAWSSTIGRACFMSPDLRKGQFSTVSTPPMTTSLRQGLRMTQAVRAAGGSRVSCAGAAGRVGIA
jgi:hypothetical protein